MTQSENVLDKEHEKLLGKLKKMASRKDSIGRIYAQITPLFRSHLKRENETVVPLLEYLRNRLREFKEHDMEALKCAASKFENDYSTMLEEHLEISRLLNMVLDEIQETPRDLPAELAHELLHHIKFEEELLYPAAIASGDLLEIEREILGQKIKY